MIRNSKILLQIFAVLFVFAGFAVTTNQTAAQTRASSAAAQKPAVIIERIVCEGDSRTNLSNSTPGSELDLTGYPAKLATLLHANYYKNGIRVIYKPANKIEVVNIGSSGDTAQAILATQTRQVVPYISPGVKTTYILDAGGNDIVNASRDAQEVISDIQKIYDIINAKGVTVYVATIGNAGVAQFYLDTAVVVNKSIRDKYPADKVIDYWNVRKLYNASNTTYFLSDEVHYTPAGNQVKAQTAFAALSR